MALAFLGTHATQGNSLVNGAVIAHHSGLADNHSASMVNQDAASQLGAGMNLDKSEKPGNLGNQPGNKKHPVFIEPVGKPVPYKGMDSLVQKKYLQGIAGSGVTFLYGLYVKPYVLEYHIYSSLSLTS